MSAITIQGTYSRPESTRNGKIRVRVIEGSVQAGDTMTVMEFRGSAQGGNVPTQYRVTGLGAGWLERGYTIDEEDARSFGGRGESIRVGSPGRLQYAYVERV
jgi:hypothetical protein